MVLSERRGPIHYEQPIYGVNAPVIYIADFIEYRSNLDIYNAFDHISILKIDVINYSYFFHNVFYQILF